MKSKVNLAEYFAIGNVLFDAYWREYEKVVAFHPATNGLWSVDVVDCDIAGNVKAGSRVRNHSTYPGCRDFIVSVAA